MYYYSDPEDRKQIEETYTVRGQAGDVRGFWDDMMELAKKWDVDIDESEV